MKKIYNKKILKIMRNLADSGLTSIEARDKLEIILEMPVKISSFRKVAIQKKIIFKSKYEPEFYFNDKIIKILIEMYGKKRYLIRDKIIEKLEIYISLSLIKDFYESRFFKLKYLDKTG